MLDGRRLSLAIDQCDLRYALDSSKNAQLDDQRTLALKEGLSA
jgi:hypothetical protein